MVAAKEKGLDLPPVVESVDLDDTEQVVGGGADSKLSESEIGKGLFDGW